MNRHFRWFLFAFCLLVVSAAYTLAQQNKQKSDANQEVIVAEGTGANEKEARKAAFRDAVSRVVGTLVDGEILIKNDEVIKERILEFSGGFVKTYDTLKTEKVAGGLVRVQIKATVERLQLVSKLHDANVTIKDVKGSDLLAEKLTKDEANHNATELLAKLYSDLPKVMKAEVKGKPRLNDQRDGIVLDLVLSVDKNAYDSFAKRAMMVLDKLATHKQSVVVAGKRDRFYGGDIEIMRLPDRRINPYTESGGNISKGYGIWLLTSIDRRFEETRWNYYWVDADAKRSLAPIAGDVKLNLKLSDKAGQVIIENEIKLHDTDGERAIGLGFRGGKYKDWPSDKAWLLCGITNRQIPFARPPSSDAKTTLFVAPLILFSDVEMGYRVTQSLKINMKVTDQELARLGQVNAQVMLTPRSTNSSE